MVSPIRNNMLKFNIIIIIIMIYWETQTNIHIVKIVMLENSFSNYY